MNNRILILVNMLLSKSDISFEDVSKIRSFGKPAVSFLIKRIKEDRLTYGKHMSPEDWFKIQKKIRLFFEAFCYDSYDASQCSNVSYILSAFKDLLSNNQISVLFNYFGFCLINPKVNKESKKSCLKILLKFISEPKSDEKTFFYKKKAIDQIYLINKEFADFLYEEVLEKSTFSDPLSFLNQFSI